MWGIESHNQFAVKGMNKADICDFTGLELGMISRCRLNKEDEILVCTSCPSQHPPRVL